MWHDETVRTRGDDEAIEALRAALAEEALQRLTDVHQEIEAALEQPEQDVPETDCGNMQVEWADIPKEFNDWWDADRLTQTNPFREDSPAYWAWEGWQARAALAEPTTEDSSAVEPVQDEPVAWLELRTLTMAREAGWSQLDIDNLLYIVETAATAEREACAAVCDARYMGDNNREDMEARRCAAAIRARSK